MSWAVDDVDHGTWRSLVAHLLWEQGVGSSNLPVPTKTSQPEMFRAHECGYSSCSPTERGVHNIADHNDSAAKKGVEGVVEDVKGRAKEAVGSLVGNDDLKDEGQAQQDKAEAQREAAEAQTEARKADAKAEASEARQKANQD